MPSDVVMDDTGVIPVGSGMSKGMLCSTFVSAAVVADGVGRIDGQVGVATGAELVVGPADELPLLLHAATVTATTTVRAAASTDCTARRCVSCTAPR